MLSEISSQNQFNSAESKENIQSSRYFEKLSLREVYGNYRVLPGTRIVTDIPLGSPAANQFPEGNDVVELMARYNLAGSMGCSNFDSDTKKPALVIISGMEKPLTEWASFWAERKAILDLAYAISGGKKPYILDVGCGNGFLAKLFANKTDVKVTGIDGCLDNYEMLPNTPGDIELIEDDIYNYIKDFGPYRSADKLQIVQESLRHIRSRYGKNARLYPHFAGHFGGLSSYGEDLEGHFNHLQQATAAEADSPVDVAVCSFMQAGVDLTPIIRDGIHPKAIVYVKEKSGMTGRGDYYSSLEREGADRVTPNTAVSFNPGQNYRTVARWNTFWQDDWGHFVYFHKPHMDKAEVVIQLRNDIAAPELTDTSPPQCVWDFEINNILAHNDYRAFQQSINQARQDITRN